MAYRVIYSSASKVLFGGTGYGFLQMHDVPEIKELAQRKLRRLCSNVYAEELRGKLNPEGAPAPLWPEPPAIANYRPPTNDCRWAILSRTRPIREQAGRAYFLTEFILCDEEDIQTAADRGLTPPDLLYGDVKEGEYDLWDQQEQWLKPVTFLHPEEHRIHLETIARLDRAVSWQHLGPEASPLSPYRFERCHWLQQRSQQFGPEEMLALMDQSLRAQFPQGVDAWKKVSFSNFALKRDFGSNAEPFTWNVFWRGTPYHDALAQDAPGHHLDLGAPDQLTPSQDAELVEARWKKESATAQETAGAAAAPTPVLSGNVANAGEVSRGGYQPDSYPPEPVAEEKSLFQNPILIALGTVGIVSALLVASFFLAGLRDRGDAGPTDVSGQAAIPGPSSQSLTTPQGSQNPPPSHQETTEDKIRALIAERTDLAQKIVTEQLKKEDHDPEALNAEIEDLLAEAKIEVQKPWKLEDLVAHQLVGPLKGLSQGPPLQRDSPQHANFVKLQQVATDWGLAEFRDEVKNLLNTINSRIQSPKSSAIFIAAEPFPLVEGWSLAGVRYANVSVGVEALFGQGSGLGEIADQYWSTLTLNADQTALQNPIDGTRIASIEWGTGNQGRMQLEAPGKPGEQTVFELQSGEQILVFPGDHALIEVADPAGLLAGKPKPDLSWFEPMPGTKLEIEFRIEEPFDVRIAIPLNESELLAAKGRLKGAIDKAIAAKKEDDANALEAKREKEGQPSPEEIQTALTTFRTIFLPANLESSYDPLAWTSKGGQQNQSYLHHWELGVPQKREPFPPAFKDYPPKRTRLIDCYVQYQQTFFSKLKDKRLETVDVEVAIAKRTEGKPKAPNPPKPIFANSKAKEALENVTQSSDVTNTTKFTTISTSLKELVAALGETGQPKLISDEGNDDAELKIATTYGQGAKKIYQQYENVRNAALKQANQKLQKNRTQLSGHINQLAEHFPKLEALAKWEKAQSQVPTGVTMEQWLDLLQRRLTQESAAHPPQGSETPDKGITLLKALENPEAHREELNQGLKARIVFRASD